MTGGSERYWGERVTGELHALCLAFDRQQYRYFSYNFDCVIRGVQNKAELLSLLSRNATTIRSFGVHRMGLFGSFVNGTVHEKSDVDLLLDFNKEEKSFRNLMDLGYFLEQLLGRKVELITRESLSPYLGPHILKSVENVSI